jgi:site-specific DNA recombinase
MRDKAQGKIRPDEARKAVGIWIRVSTEDQVRGESPEHHEHRARHYAEAKGWAVRELYRLDAVSGKTVMASPEAKRMLADVRSGRITGLIFSKLARLARNTKELLEFSEIFRAEGADLISLQESIDTSSPAGRLFYTMIAAMAQWEREEIAERVAASIPIRAKLGKPLGGAAPFGYEWRDRKLVPHPVEGPIRRRIYELYIEHKRVKTVTRLMNEAGHRTRRGTPFNHTTVAWLLQDPTAKGLRRANYTRERSGTKGWEYKPAEDWVTSDVEPVVPEALWDEANAILEEGRDMLRRRGRPPIHSFAGRAYCTCGTKMYVHSKTPKYVCRKCLTKVSVDDLETIFHEQLKGFLLSPEEIARHLEEANETVQAKQESLGALEAEGRQLAHDMDKTYLLYLADQIAPEGFGRIYRPLEERKRQIEDELPRLQAELDVLKIQLISQDDILAQARDIYARWPDFIPAERRRIVEAIVDRIEVGKEEVKIVLAHVPSLIGAKREENSRSSGGAPRCARRAWAPRRAAW